MQVPSATAPGPPIPAHVHRGASALAVVEEYGERIKCGPFTEMSDNNVLMGEYAAKCASRDTVRSGAYSVAVHGCGASGSAVRPWVLVAGCLCPGRWPPRR